MKPRYTLRQVAHLIQRLVVIREAELGPQLPGIIEKDRPLSGDGIKQARLLQAAFAHSGLRFDASFTSPRLSATQTQNYALSEIPNTQPRVPELDPDLPGKDTLIGIDLKRLGSSAYYYAYVKVPGCEELLLDLGQKALEAIIAKILDSCNPGSPRNCVVFGHAPLLLGLIHALIRLGNNRTVASETRQLYELFLLPGRGVSLRYQNTDGYSGFMFENAIRL